MTAFFLLKKHTLSEHFPKIFCNISGWFGKFWTCLVLALRNLLHCTLGMVLFGSKVKCFLPVRSVGLVSTSGECAAQSRVTSRNKTPA